MEAAYANAPPPTPEYLAESAVPGWQAATLTSMIIASIFFAARLYSRLGILRTWGWEDSCLVIGWVFGVTNAVLNFVLMHYKSGRHWQLSTMHDVHQQMLVTWALRLIYQVSLSFTKLSIACFYLRVFPNRRDKMFARGLIVFIVLWSIPMLLIMMFQCSPVQEAWSMVRTKPCPISDPAVIVTCGVLNVFSDCLLTIWVVPKIVGLKMHLKQKIILMCIVLTSVLIIIAGIIRVVLTERAIRQIDQPWNFAEIGIWSIVEVATGIFCASIIAVKPLVRRIFPHALSTVSSSGRHGGYGGADSSSSHAVPGYSSSGHQEKRGRWQRRSHPLSSRDDLEAIDLTYSESERDRDRDRHGTDVDADVDGSSARSSKPRSGVWDGYYSSPEHHHHHHQHRDVTSPSPRIGDGAYGAATAGKGHIGHRRSSDADSGCGSSDSDGATRSSAGFATHAKGPSSTVILRTTDITTETVSASDTLGGGGMPRKEERGFGYAV